MPKPDTQTYTSKLEKPALDASNAPIPGTDREVSVRYHIGATLSENIDLFTEEVVNSQFSSAVVAGLQALIRRGLKAGLTDEEIQAHANTWKPGVRQVVQKDRKLKAVDALSALSDEEKRELLAKVAAQLGGKK